MNLRRVQLPFATALLTVVGLLAAAQVSAQPRESVLVIPEVTEPPRLEDFLTDAPAVPALRIDAFTQRQPGDGEPASERTIAYLSRDRTSLYVVFLCSDREPQKIRAHLTKREQTAADDLVGVILDTFHDRRRAYLFLANPRGIQRDAMLTEGQTEDLSFDTLWESHGQLTATGYAVWIAIPFKSLRFASGSAETWGIGLTRRIPRTTEEVFWPLVTRRVEGIVPQLATIGGFEAVRPGRNVQFIPYGAFADAAFLDRAALQRRSDHDARGGLDVKAGARPLYARSDGEPRFQPGGNRRSPSHDQPAIGSLFPGKETVLSRERRNIPDPRNAVLFPAHCCSSLGDTADRKRWPLGRRFISGGRPAATERAGGRRGRGGGACSTRGGKRIHRRDAVHDA